jgi:two-component system, NarL family, sensor kinase
MSRVCFRSMLLLIILNCICSWGCQQGINENSYIEMRLDSLHQASTALFYSYPDSAARINKEIGQLSEKSGNPIWKIRHLNMAGIISDIKSQWDSAYYYYHEALRLSELHDYADQIASISNNIGYLNWKTGNYNDALFHFYRASDSFDRSGRKDRQGVIYLNIGLIYSDLGLFDRALSHYRMAYSAQKEFSDTVSVSNAYFNIAFSLNEQGQADSALYYLDLALEMQQLSRNFIGYCSSLDLKAWIYFQKNDYQTARILYYQIIDLSQSIQNFNGLVRAYMGLSALFSETGNFNIAIDYTNKAMVLAREYNYQKLLIRGHENLSTIFEKYGHVQKAIHHRKKACQLVEERQIFENLHQVYYQELDYAKKQRLAEIEKANHEQVLQRLVVRKQRAILLMFGLILLTVIISCYFYLLKNRHKHQANLKHAMLIEQQEGLKDILEAEILERKRIGCELHDGIGQMLSVIRLNISVLQQKQGLAEQKAQKLLTNCMLTLKTASEEIFAVSKNLSPCIFNNNTLECAINELVDQLDQSQKLKVHYNSRGEISKMDQFVQSSVYRCVQELINNVIKHSQASDLFIDIFNENDLLKIIIRDNGKGFEADQQKINKGTGLAGVRFRIENLNGSFIMNTRQGEGSCFSLSVPL